MFTDIVMMRDIISNNNITYKQQSSEANYNPLGIQC